MLSVSDKCANQSIHARLRTLDGQVGADRYLFQSRESKGGTLPMAERQVNRIVLDAAKQAGIDSNVSAHWLRHSNATHALKNGASLPVVQASLGHASLVTTSRYLHIDPNEGTSQFIDI